MISFLWKGGIGLIQENAFSHFRAGAKFQISASFIWWLIFALFVDSLVNVNLPIVQEIIFFSHTIIAENYEKIFFLFPKSRR
jgi:hypothetical protein